jgi:hypothetical protein
MKIFLVILLTSAAASLQTSDQFRGKYGPPVSETYLVSPGILATVNYSKDGKPCSATIAAQTKRNVTEKQKPISPELMRAIVNEFVANTQRGKLLDSGFLNLTCVDCDSFYGGYEQYEKVRVTIGGKGDGQETASIQWTGVSCDR